MNTQLNMNWVYITSLFTSYEIITEKLDVGDIEYNIVLFAIANFKVLVVQMDELACFAPGMLTLGTEGASPEKAKEYLDLAEEVTRL